MASACRSSFVRNFGLFCSASSSFFRAINSSREMGTFFPFTEVGFSGSVDRRLGLGLLCADAVAGSWGILNESARGGGWAVFRD